MFGPTSGKAPGASKKARLENNVTTSYPLVEGDDGGKRCSRWAVDIKGDGCRG